MIAPPRSLFLLVLATTVTSAAPTLTVDLAAPPPGSNITRVFGHAGNNLGVAGVPVCGGFDCDGDGHRDFGVSYFQASAGGNFAAGEVSVVFGDGTIGGTLDTGIPQAGILTITGEELFEATGSEIWMDDLTGDGLGDLLIARQNYTFPGSPDREGAGALAILVGSAGWKTHAATLAPLELGNPPPGLQLITFVGPAEYDRLGIWMRAGDITGDGIADLVVGADEVDAEGSPVSQNQGAVFVVRGGPHLLDSPAFVDLATFGTPAFPENLKGHVAWIDPPENAADFHFGATVQVGDLDGNGRAEVIAAAALSRAGAGVRIFNAPSGTGEAEGGTTDGTVFIVWDENFPPGPWPEDYRFRATSPPVGDYTRIDGDTAARNFGEELIGGLDFSGDGFPDLMVGDLTASPNNRNNAGRGYIFYNAGNLRGMDFKLNLAALPPGIAVTTIAGPRGGAISSDTVLHGDFDGDGLADLGVGNPHDDPQGRADAGSLHVLYGRAGGWPTTIDLSVPNLPDPGVMRIALVEGALGSDGSSTGDTLCYSAAAGDINSDGRPDLIVNEMAGDGSGGSPEDIGNLLVIDAASLLAPFTPVLQASLSGPVDFGAVPVDGGSATRSLSFTNTGGATVGISTVGIFGPAFAHFAITADSGQTELDPGESLDLTITYDPSLVGRSGAGLLVLTDADPHPQTIGLAGRGVDDALATPDLLFLLIGDSAFFEVPATQFGTTYTLLRDPTLTSPTPLQSLPGNGFPLYFSDPGIGTVQDTSLYRVEASRD